MAPPEFSSPSSEIDGLLRNAYLRDELEPLFDEAIGSINVRLMNVGHENDFLESMLDWERAPMVPISQWFEPELVLPPPHQLSESRLREILANTINRLFRHYIVLDFTDHLSDRELYTLIYRDILPAYEKKLSKRQSYLHWDCASASGDTELWLRYYATEEERQIWADETGCEPPPQEVPPYARQLPEAPL